VEKLVAVTEFKLYSEEGKSKKVKGKSEEKPI
jgi:hypothetical protein